jgi:hypothetical protein
MFRFIIYADDTTLLATISSLELTNTVNLEQNIIHELENISNWLKLNKLSLNASKTKCMLFHTINKRLPSLHLHINNQDIEHVKTFEYLGIKIDEGLLWNAHIEKIRKKITKVIGILTHLRRFISSQTLLTLYNSLILPHLLYGVLLWGHKSKIAFKLQSEQYR